MTSVIDTYLDLLDSQRETAFNAIDNLTEDKIWQRPAPFEHHTIDKAYVIAYDTDTTILKP
jgi:hypothetical protein